MELFKIRIIETLTLLIAYIVFYFITKGLVNNSLKQTHLHRGRRKMIIKAINLLSFTTFVIISSAIWGLKQNEIAVFVGTLLTALGIAFFAQWSLLSNITSSLLLFFNHPMKIGDTIKVLDKEYPFGGEVFDVTYFFVYIRTATGETVSIPNSIFLQKSISIVEQK